MSTIKIKPQAWLRSRQPYFNGSGAEARRAPQGLYPERRLQAAAADAASVPAA